MAELNGALIGCGFFAINQMHAWNDVAGAKITAICDRDPERLKIVGDQFGIERRYTDAEALFADGGIDFVDIATTVASHRALVELAAAHKVPAICQKPFAKTLDDAKAMVKVCDEAGIPLMVHENFRWQTPIQAVRKALDSGVIGTPFWGRFSFRSGFDVFSGQPYLAEGDRFIIEDLGIHTLDIARFILDDVTSLVARTKRVNPKIKGEDVATILMDHENGATSIVDVSYATKLENDPFPETLIELDGTEGTIRLHQGYRLEVITPAGTAVSDVSPRLLSWASRPWHNIQESVFAIQQHWVDKLASNGETSTSGADNLKTFALVEAAYDSAATGNRIDIKALLK
ncbi:MULTISPECIES: Gfo/Idh/MocA family protein [Brucella/Ochrobactrum group]|uniref:Gfo/Idh/MocA family oxidoreductase n=1 Tax=Brucella pseudintermedia TaxID=370111 RepID=A0ABY5UHB4_9HYPH|nr:MULTISPECIES: Gfo/Idh/MocA family oxidoreductase [Brucella/Ochrobactrum group]KAB2683593.1 Gfo/Idh/MocA family oxidoreductase [Brucella pseudintermedia]MCO7726021.1 Gfo/Idh/MocA family oxidoreductase [Brucella intermedia]NKE73883.1 Gfo/Idh/MocA family oxidoreductase [Ochrobactrum sp. MC-1LL]TWG96644.1 putative dehydrogenase [Ochrobactrum sp. J50]UWL62756.1 Gfo/Idh/MocA family oxidoreductase [Brucella pseudintermedia]